MKVLSFNPLMPGADLNNNEKFSSYVDENTTHIYYKAQLINALP
jgi:hypothetical protein